MSRIARAARLCHRNGAVGASMIRGVASAEPSSLDPRTLRTARRRAGLSRERLAALAGVSSSTIYRLETARVGPHRVTALALAAALERHADINDEAPAITPALRETSTAEQGRHASA